MSESRREAAPARIDAVLIEGSPARRRVLDLAASDERRKALLMDPSLAATGAPSGDFSDREVQELKRSVLQARRLRAVESPSGERVSHGLSGLAMALTLCLIFLLPSSLRRSPDSGVVVPGVDSRDVPEIMTHSAVEALDLPGARVYELADEDFSVVLVVDESFEL